MQWLVSSSSVSCICVLYSCYIYVCVHILISASSYPQCCYFLNVVLIYRLKFCGSEIQSGALQLLQFVCYVNFLHLSSLWFFHFGLVLRLLVHPDRLLVLIFIVMNVSNALTSYLFIGFTSFAIFCQLFSLSMSFVSFEKLATNFITTFAGRT